MGQWGFIVADVLEGYSGRVGRRGFEGRTVEVDWRSRISTTDSIRIIRFQVEIDRVR